MDPSLSSRARAPPHTTRPPPTHAQLTATMEPVRLQMRRVAVLLTGGIKRIIILSDWLTSSNPARSNPVRGQLPIGGELAQILLLLLTDRQTDRRSFDVVALRHLEEDGEAWKSVPLLNEITYSASNHEAVINKQPAGILCSAQGDSNDATD